MQRFQDLLTQAAQLKQQQLKQERKNFQALPEYLKSGLNFAKKYTQLRKQHYLIQQYISQKLKKHGNDQYMLQNYSQALSNYQQALSIFRYIHATKYQNLKDQDIIYENYSVSEQHIKSHQDHLQALYLNICSALTKMNKKQEAVHAAEQAMKISDNNPKVFYKKAQAYLQYINRDSNDIKLGFYYLNKAYELSKDHTILSQMHKIKKQLDEQRQKQKNWFKFMFNNNDKNNKNNNNNKNNADTTAHHNSNIHAVGNNVMQAPLLSIDKAKSHSDNNNVQLGQQSPNGLKSRKLRQQLDKFHQQHTANNSQQHKQLTIVQKHNLQRTKLSLKPYLIIPRDDRWLIKYQQDFIHNHGSKIYSILQLNTKNHLLLQFKSLLAKCLELKQAKITPQRDQAKLLEEKIVMYGSFVEWVKTNCFQGGYRKYVERYNLQTQWITANRGLPIDEVYTKQELSAKTLKTNSTKHKSKQLTQEKQSTKHDMKQQAQEFIKQVRRSALYHKQGDKQEKNKSTKDDKSTAFKFKQQWQRELEQQQQRKGTPTISRKQHSQKEDEVPANIKAYLENYDDLPTTFGQQQHNKHQTQKKHHNNIYQQQQQQHHQTQHHQVKLQSSHWSSLKTFAIIFALVLLFKLIF